MSRQDSLFDDGLPGTGAVALGIPGSAPALNRAQKQFNKLVEEIAALRQRLAAWQEFPQRYHCRVEEELRPLEASLHDGRIAMAGVFDRALLGKGLTRREKSIARELLATMVHDLVEEDAADAELAELAARHGLDLPPDDVPDSLEALQALGREVFGIDLDADHGAASPEELAQLFADKLAAEEAERAAKRKARPKSAKVREREAQADRLAEDAGRTLREVYRRLARELHPDRITDDEERVRKTGLMQDANRAYEARDLLALLELQWKIEQIDPARLAGLAEEKLTHFNHVLKEQAQSLREEIETYAVPFFVHFERAPPRDLQPAHVEREMDRHTADLRKTMSDLQRDLKRYADLAELKRDLKDYERAPPDDDFEALLEALAQTMPSTPRVKRRTKRRR